MLCGDMNAKHSAILLTGLLLLMIGIAWAQSKVEPPTCPPLEDGSLQQMLQPEAWVKAYWNANMSRWEIDCKQIDAEANMARPYPANGANAMVNAANAARIPGRRTNSNYVNTDPYNYLRNINANANMAANAPGANANAVRRPKAVRREPNTRRPIN
jgi:hypothetical protein